MKKEKNKATHFYSSPDIRKSQFDIFYVLPHGTTVWLKHINQVWVSKVKNPTTTSLIFA